MRTAVFFTSHQQNILISLHLWKCVIFGMARHYILRRRLYILWITQTSEKFHTMRNYINTKNKYKKNFCRVFLLEEEINYVSNFIKWENIVSMLRENISSEACMYIYSDKLHYMIIIILKNYALNKPIWRDLLLNFHEQVICIDIEPYTYSYVL